MVNCDMLLRVTVSSSDGECGARDLRDRLGKRLVVPRHERRLLPEVSDERDPPIGERANECLLLERLAGLARRPHRRSEYHEEKGDEHRAGEAPRTRVRPACRGNLRSTRF